MTELYDLKKNKEKISPEGGWKKFSYYSVYVSYSEYNPVHQAILYTGFTNGEEPGSYNYIHGPGYDKMYNYDEVHFIEPIEFLCTLK